jgi:hypothetical protein
MAFAVMYPQIVFAKIKKVFAAFHYLCGGFIIGGLTGIMIADLIAKAKNKNN